MKAAASNVQANRRLFVRSVMMRRILFSMGHVYHLVLRVLFFLVISVFNVQKIVSNARLELLAQHVQQHTTFMKVLAILTAIRYLSNTMLKEMLVFFVQQGAILVLIMCVILAWKGTQRMIPNA